jgi:hypothetical protein
MGEDHLTVASDEEIEAARVFWQKLGGGSLVLSPKDYYEAILVGRRTSAEAAAQKRTEELQEKLVTATWVLAVATIVLAVATIVLIVATIVGD